MGGVERGRWGHGSWVAFFDLLYSLQEPLRKIHLRTTPMHVRTSRKLRHRNRYSSSDELSPLEHLSETRIIRKCHFGERRKKNIVAHHLLLGNRKNNVILGMKRTKHSRVCSSHTLLSLQKKTTNLFFFFFQKSPPTHKPFQKSPPTHTNIPFRRKIRRNRFSWKETSSATLDGRIIPDMDP